MDVVTQEKRQFSLLLCAWCLLSSPYHLGMTGNYLLLASPPLTGSSSRPQVQAAQYLVACVLGELRSRGFGSSVIPQLV